MENIDLDGLSVPNVIQSEIDTYRREQDSIAQFIEECCETFDQAKTDRPDEYIISTDYRTANTEPYRAYKRFCEENGEYLRSHRRLSQNLQERRLSPNEIRRPLLGRDQTLSVKLNTAQTARNVPTPNIGGMEKWTLCALRAVFRLSCGFKKESEVRIVCPKCPKCSWLRSNLFIKRFASSSLFETLFQGNQPD